jgi:catechol 2,3-dioxygenase-like lactoylglutathione lyase family enzyme
MIDHVGIPVRDFARSKAFYEKLLAPLGYVCAMEFDGKVGGFAVEGKPDFWIAEEAGEILEVHVAFLAKDRASVNAFHAAGLAAGGKDNGAPGLRPEYHATYFGAFIDDPDGHNVEAVCHKPE